MYRRVLYFFAFVLFISACNPHLKTEANNLPQGYADSQVVGTWKITAFSSNLPNDWDQNGSAETDIYNLWTPCEKDNLYIFVGNKTGTFKIDCNNIKDGYWEIDRRRYLLIGVLNQPPEGETLISMTSNEFKTQIKVIVSSGQEFTLIKTWTRQ